MFNRLVKIKEFLDQNDPHAVLIPFSGILENKLVSMSPEERTSFCESSKTQRFDFFLN